MLLILRDEKVITDEMVPFSELTQDMDKLTLEKQTSEESGPSAAEVVS